MASTNTTGGYTAQAANVDISIKFKRNLDSFQKILGAGDVQILADGTNLTSYVNTIVFQDGVVTAGQTIPASTVSSVATARTLTFKKWRKPVPIENIAKQGYEGAVVATDEQLLANIQKAARGTIIGALASGTGSATAGATFQKALANVWAAVEAAFEDEAVIPVYFVNYDTVAEYLGSAAVTVQSETGISYIENFMGIPGRLIIDSSVPADTIYGTATGNLVIAAADVSGIQELGMHIDESGMFAVAHNPALAEASVETIVYCGLCVFAMFADKVIVGEVDPS